MGRNLFTYKGWAALHRVHHRKTAHLFCAWIWRKRHRVQSNCCNYYCGPHQRNKESKYRSLFFQTIMCHGIKFVAYLLPSPGLLTKRMHMLNLRKPALIFAVIGLVLFFLGLYMLTMDPKNGYVIMYIGLGIGVIYWIWSVI